MSRFLSAFIWLAILAGFVFFIDQSLNPNKAERLSPTQTVTLKRDPSGHYRAEAFINGVKVPVLVDTGATGIAISQHVADRLGLQSQNAVRTQTANGETVGYLLRLESVKLGGIEVHDVAASIAPGLADDEALLGMSFLGRLDVRLYRGNMTIKQ